jgi:hypothetical protein
MVDDGYSPPPHTSFKHLKTIDYIDKSLVCCHFSKTQFTYQAELGGEYEMS